MSSLILSFFSEQTGISAESHKYCHKRCCLHLCTVHTNIETSRRGSSGISEGLMVHESGWFSAIYCNRKIESNMNHQRNRDTIQNLTIRMFKLLIQLLWSVIIKN